LKEFAKSSHTPDAPDRTGQEMISILQSPQPRAPMHRQGGVGKGEAAHEAPTVKVLRTTEKVV